MQRYLLLLLSSKVCVMTPERPVYSLTQFMSESCFIARLSANAYITISLRSAARCSDLFLFAMRLVDLHVPQECLFITVTSRKESGLSIRTLDWHDTDLKHVAEIVEHTAFSRFL